MVPSGWVFGRIDNFFILQRGYDLTSKNRVEGPVPVYSSSGLAYFHNEIKVKGPGIVTGRKGSVGKVFLIKEDFWPHDTTLWVKDFKGNNLEFVAYFLRSLNLERLDESSSVPTLNRNNVHRIKVLFPPVSEQQKIAKTLSTWDKAITTAEKLIATSKQQKKSLMQLLFTGRKRLRSSPKDGAETGKAFEGEWEEVNIASRFELITDYVASGSFASLKENVNVQDIESYAHYVRQTDLAAKFNNKKLKWVDKDSYDFLNKSNLFEGDILFTNIGDLGKVFYMPKLIKPATVAPNLVVLRTNQSNDSRFIYYMLASDVGQREIEKIKSGTGLPKINKTEFKTMKFRIPHLEEQQRIASVLTAADKEIEVLEVKLAHFKQEKKALMQQLLTGKLRVKVDEEVAA